MLNRANSGHDFQCVGMASKWTANALSTPFTKRIVNAFSITKNANSKMRSGVISCNTERLCKNASKGHFDAFPLLLLLSLLLLLRLAFEGIPMRLRSISRRLEDVPVLSLPFKAFKCVCGPFQGTLRFPPVLDKD